MAHLFPFSDSAGQFAKKKLSLFRQLFVHSYSSYKIVLHTILYIALVAIATTTDRQQVSICRCFFTPKQKKHPLVFKI